MTTPTPTTTQELEEKIRALKARREALVATKAEKVAQLKAAQEELKRLKDEVEAKGYTLKDIPELHVQKRKELNGKVALFEAALTDVEEALKKYS